jgi:acetyltransferase-like isoleucine patch superfamily enzyme
MSATNRLIASVAKLGARVKIYAFTNLYRCSIGDDSKIGTFVEIQKESQIGKRCKISSHSFICEGVRIEEEVFIGHGITFTNDLSPKATNQDGSSQTEDDWKVIGTTIKKGASIGSGSTLLCGITIEEGAMVGAGSMVTKDVPGGTVVAGTVKRV